MELWRLIAHNHWFTLGLGGYRIRVCSRCSGYLSGLILFSLPFGLIDLSMGLSQRLLAVGCAVFAVPLILDWVTQSWGMRCSTNTVRFLTGVSMGCSLGFFSLMSLEPRVKEIVYVSILLLVFITGIWGKNMASCSLTYS